MNVDPTANVSEPLIGLCQRGSPRWSTASFGRDAVSRPGDDVSLGEHLHLCRSISGRLFGLQCRVETVHDFLSGRVVTTLAVVMMLAGLALILS